MSLRLVLPLSPNDNHLIPRHFTMPRSPKNNKNAKPALGEADWTVMLKGADRCDRCARLDLICLVDFKGGRLMRGCEACRVGQHSKCNACRKGKHGV